MVHVVGFDHLVLRCTDVERSLAFYCEQLGLEGVRVDQWQQGEAPFPSVRVDATTIIDLLAGVRDGTNLDHFCLVLGATDLRALAASGQFEVLGEGAVEELFGAQGLATSLYVRDPDGNVVELRCYD